jgi:hypothetical protein
VPPRGRALRMRKSPRRLSSSSSCSFLIVVRRPRRDVRRTHMTTARQPSVPCSSS